MANSKITFDNGRYTLLPRMRHPLTFRLADYSIEGEAAKLQPFLEEQKAVEVTEQTYRKVDFKNAQS